LLAADRPAADDASTGECGLGEGLAAGVCAVVQDVLRRWFVDVQVDAQLAAVVEYEVPRPITWPGEHAVDAEIGQGHDERLEGPRVQPQVEVGVLACLFAQRGIGGPPSSHVDVGAVPLQALPGEVRAGDGKGQRRNSILRTY
jgi:hypothetical protein